MVRVWTQKKAKPLSGSALLSRANRLDCPPFESKVGNGLRHRIDIADDERKDQDQNYAFQFVLHSSPPI
jgi:hypothetical protein